MRRIMLGATLLPIVALAQSPLQSDDRLVTGELANGLDYYIMPLAESPTRPTVEMRLLVNAGSLDETDAQQGYAHILEHMAFNGSENYSENEVVDFFERAGMQFGGDINAYTSFSETVYMLSIPADDEALVSEAYQVLGDWAYRLDISPAEVEKEIGVVLEEWRSRNSEDSVQTQSRNAYIGDTIWAERLPIGTQESIQGVTAQGLQAYYDTHYQPDRMAVMVAGPVDVEQTIARLKEEFGDFADTSDVEPAQAQDSFAETGRPWHKFSDQNVANTSIEFSRITRESSDWDIAADFEQRLLSFVVSNAVNTRLAEIVNASGSPVTDLRYSSADLWAGHMVNSLSAQVKTERLQEATVLLEQERLRLLEYGLSEAEIASSYAQAVAMYENYINQLANAPANAFIDPMLASALMSETLVPSAASQLALLQDMQISTSDAQAFLEKTLTDGGYTLTHPEGKHESVDSEQVARWLAQARSQDIEPFAVAEAVETAGMAFPGDVVGSEPLEVAGGYQLLLDNGQQAWLLESDVVDGKVQLQLQLANGLLQLPDDIIPSASLLPYLVNQQPRLGYSASQLESETTTRQVQWGMSIEDYTGYVYVEFPVEEAAFATELLLDVIYNPLPDTSRLAEDIAAYQANFEGFAATANGEFSRTYFVSLWGDTNHAWPNYELVNQDTLAQAAQLLTSDQNLWALAGDMDAQTGATLLANYVASAPVVSFPALAERPITIPEGSTEVVNGATEDSASTELLRATPMAIDPTTASLAVRVVNKRIIEEVREAQSLIYSGQAYFLRTDEVFGQNIGAVNWSAEPSRTPEVIAAVNQTIADLVAQGVSDEQLTTAKRQAINGYKEYFTSLNGVMAVLTDAFDRQTLPKDQLQMTATIEAITSEAVTEHIDALFQGPAFQLTFQP